MQLNLDFVLSRLDMQKPFLPLEMVWIDAGEFIKKNFIHSATNRKDPLEVKLKHGFWISKYLVTIEQWQKVMNIERDYNTFKQANLPITGIDWSEAMNFCTTLNLLYQNTLPKGYQFSLPTEFQWEYVCRKGFSFDVDTDAYFEQLSNYAWLKSGTGNSDNVQPVGKKSPNTFGIYDIVGNCFVWCLDELSEYPEQKAIEWVGKNNNLSLKVIKGFTFRASIKDPSIRIGTRSYMLPSVKTNFVSFRVAIRKISSPKIIHSEWGKIEIDNNKIYKDVKCFLGGCCEWDWGKTGTHHMPGVQIADVEEILNTGVDIIVISKGYHEKLHVKDETISFFKDKGLQYYILETSKAVEKYNELVDLGESVGGLFHSTC